MKKINEFDIFIIFFILFLSFLVRIWMFYHPKNIIFDEVHFGTFVNKYNSGEYFFDIHPPLAKLIFYWISLLFNYDNSTNFEDGPNFEYNNDFYISFRLTPIIFSSFVPSFIYLILKFNSCSIISSLIPSILMIFETTLISEGKLILTDGILHFFTSLNLVIYSYFNNLKKKTFLWNFFLYLTGITLGFSISCKYTSLSLCLFIALSEIIKIFKEIKNINLIFFKELINRGLILFFISFGILILFWIIHIIILPYHSWDSDTLDEDGLNTFINKNNNTLDWSFRIGPPSIFIRIYRIQIRSHISNSVNFMPHGSMSLPKNWPLLKDIGVFLFKDKNFIMFCIGNPITYYCVVFGLIFNFLKFKNKLFLNSIKFLFGWIFSFLPFLLVPRTVFLYHYIIPLIFGIICFGLFLEMFFSKYFRSLIGIFLIFLVIFYFIGLSPVIYGLNESNLLKFLWFKRWSEGAPDRQIFIDFMKKKHEAFLKTQINCPKMELWKYSENKNLL